VIEEFITYLIREKKYTGNTIVAYQTDLLQFQTFLRDQYETDQTENANHYQIRSWIVTLFERNISKRSIRRKLATLSTYYKYLKRKKLISSNPIEKVVAPKFNGSLPSFIKNHEMEELLGKTDFGEGFESLRDKLILAVFYMTGMRRSEMISLHVKDIDSGISYFKVTGKRSKQRLIPIASALKSLLSQYLDARASLLSETGEVSPFIFITSKGKQVYPNLIYRIVTKYIGYVSTNTKKNPHTLRHSFATNMMNNGADLNIIKEILGHSNLQATQVYTHNSIESLKSIYKQAHPRAK
jgi:integrase/recombinase XerC